MCPARLASVHLGRGPVERQALSAGPDAGRRVATLRAEVVRVTMARWQETAAGVSVDYGRFRVLRSAVGWAKSESIIFKCFGHTAESVVDVFCCELGMESLDRPLGLINSSLGPDWPVHLPLSQAKQCVRRRDGHKDAGVQENCEALHRVRLVDYGLIQQGRFRGRRAMPELCHWSAMGAPPFTDRLSPYLPRRACRQLRG